MRRTKEEFEGGEREVISIIQYSYIKFSHIQMK